MEVWNLSLDRREKRQHGLTCNPELLDLSLFSDPLIDLFDGSPVLDVEAVGSVVISVLEFQSEDQKVGVSRLGWSLHYFVVSLYKKLCLELSLFTQVYK